MTKTIYKTDTREVIAIITDEEKDVLKDGYSIQYNKGNAKGSNVYELGADARYTFMNGKLVLCDMTREEIDKVVKEIREHCKNNNCNNCEAKTINGCVFRSGFPNEWLTTEEADKGSDNE